jgi:WD40 repeat protein
VTSTAALSAPASPYKGLAPFDDSDLDALLFFGRERETEIVAANVLASRLTVLYGPSGVGKSSLLRAGVVRSLRAAPEPAPAVVVYGSWAGDALLGLEEAARSAVTEAIGREPTEAPGGLADRLAAWTAELGAELCLLLDQLEELFLYHGPETGAGGFLDLLPELVTRPGLHVHILLGIRDDALAQLDVFKERLPGLFANSLRLDHLDQDAARGAILGPLERYNRLAAAGAQMDIEPALVAAVLAEVEAGRIEKGFAGRGSADVAAPRAGRVETPYLQLVMQRIWDVERERGSSVLRVSTLRDLGGAERIVESHLERAMAALTPAQQDAAADMFGHLVTPSGTKVAHGVTDLASYAAIDAPELEPVLRSLAHERILRPLGENGHAAGDRYEIFHDVLAGAVLAWRTRHDADTALVREREASRRRHRILLGVIAAALIALAAMTALTLYAFSQRSEAKDQAARAAAAAELARQRQAESVQQQEAAESAKADAEAAREDAEEQARKADAQERKAVEARKRANRLAADAQTARKVAQKQAVLAHGNEAQAKESAAAAKEAQDEAEDAAAEADSAKARAQKQARLARRERDRAETLRRGAAARALAQKAFAQLTVDPAESLQLAYEASEQMWDDLFEDALRQALVASRVRLVLEANARVRAAHYSRGGSRLVTASDDGAARVYQVRGDRRKLLHTLRHRRASVYDASFDASGALLITAGSDRRGGIWSAQTGRLLRSLPHKDIVWTAAFSRDGRLVATASEDRTVKIWLRNGDHERTLHVDGAALSASFSPDNTMVAVVVRAPDGPRTTRVFDVRSGDTVFAPSQRGIQTVAFSPDSTLLATASSDRTTKIWTIGKSEPLRTLEQPEGWIVDAEFSPDGKLIATASQGATVGVWEVHSGRRLQLLCCPDNFFLSASFSPDGKHVVATSRDRTARVYEVLTGRQLTLLAGHEESVLTAEFSPDGRRVVTASADGTARVWDPGAADQLEVVGRHPRPVRAARFSPDGAAILAAGDDGTARLWPAGGGLELRSFRHGQAIVSSAFSPDGTLVATASRTDGTARVWRAANGIELVRFRRGQPERVLFAPNSRGLLITERGGAARIVDARTGGDLAEPPSGGRITAASFSRDGALLAIGRVDGTAALLDARNGTLRRAIEAHEGEIVAIAFNPNGTRILTAGRDGTARLWNTRTGEPDSVLKGHEGPLTDARFDRKGLRVVTASADNDARIWDASTGKSLHTLRFHFGPVAKASFSADGRWVVTAGPTTAALWRTETGAMLSFLRGPTSTVTTASFSPRGHRVLAASTDGSVRVYNCDVCGGRSELRGLAKRRLDRARAG